jgi:hypothetical protein
MNQPVEKDLQMIKDLGLDPAWIPPQSPAVPMEAVEV